MIFRSRRWRLAIRLGTLGLTTLLMFVFAGPVTYALQDDEPTFLSTPAQLHDPDSPVEGAYINARGVPDVAHTVAVKDLLSTYYWMPVEGFDTLLFIRTDDLDLLQPLRYDWETGSVRAGTVEFSGRVASLKAQLDNPTLADGLSRKGLSVDPERAMFISLGEVPSSYRPMVPVLPALAWVWLAAFIGFVRIVRRKQPYLTGAPLPSGAR